WNITEGLVATQNASNSSVMGTGNINLSRATLRLIPTTSANGPAVLQGVASGTGKGFTFGPGAILDLNHGNTGVSFTATIGDPAAVGGAAFTRGARGTLLITAASGFANLGSAGNESLMVNGGITTVATNSTGGGPH